MTDSKRGKFDKIYLYFHHLKGYEKKIRKSYHLHHIIPFEEIGHCIPEKVIDSFLNFIYLEENFHKELSREIAFGNHFYKIEFLKDKNGEYNYFSLIKLNKNKNHSKEYFKYEDKFIFKNKDLAFYSLEWVKSIENYNKECLEYYYNQLYGEWKWQCSTKSSDRNSVWN